MPTLSREDTERLCAPKMSGNVLIALLQLKGLTFARPRTTVTHEWFTAMTYGDPSNAIELLVNVKGWVERRGHDYAITESGKAACQAIVKIAAQIA